jgi:hypothetical protein
VKKSRSKFAQISAINARAAGRDSLPVFLAAALMLLTLPSSIAYGASSDDPIQPAVNAVQKDFQNRKTELEKTREQLLAPLRKRRHAVCPECNPPLLRDLEGFQELEPPYKFSEKNDDRMGKLEDLVHAKGLSALNKRDRAIYLEREREIAILNGPEAKQLIQHEIPLYREDRGLGVLQTFKLKTRADLEKKIAELKEELPKMRVNHEAMVGKIKENKPRAEAIVQSGSHGPFVQHSAFGRLSGGESDLGQQESDLAFKIFQYEDALTVAEEVLARIPEAALVVQPAPDPVLPAGSAEVPEEKK